MDNCNEFISAFFGEINIILSRRKVTDLVDKNLNCISILTGTPDLIGEKLYLEIRETVKDQNFIYKALKASKLFGNATEKDIKNMIDSDLNVISKYAILAYENIDEKTKNSVIENIDNIQLFIDQLRDLIKIEKTISFKERKAYKLKKQITPLDSQYDHINRIIQLLAERPFALDLSMLGTGKTFTTSYIGTLPQMGFKNILVIAPKSVCVKWNQVKEEYGIPLIDAMTYQTMTSRTNLQPGHGFLTRRDYKETIIVKGKSNEIDVVEFKTTKKYNNLVKDGLLLVFDEIHHLKNLSQQFFASKELIREINQQWEENNTVSRTLLLSGSPFDKEEHITAFCKLVGIMKASETSYMLGPKTKVLTGLKEIHDFAYAFDPKLVNKKYNLETQRISGIKDKFYIEDIFQGVIKGYISSEMLPPKYPDVVLYKYNAEYNINNKEDRQLLEEGISGLENIVGGNRNDGEGMQIGDMMRNAKEQAGGIVYALVQIQKAMMKIEYAKIGTFIRIASEYLETHPTSKVAICVNYKETIVELKTGLSNYKPLILTGETDMRKRTDAITKFQRGDLEYRLIIGNISVMSTGIDLDDKFGNFPRMAFVSPNYNTIDLYQLSHRFLRSDTKSDASIHFVFGKKPLKELAIINSLARKSNIMKRTTAQQANSGVLFPGDLPDWFEN